MMKMIIALLFFFTVVNAEALKDMEFGNAIVKEVTSIYDGDTFRADIKDYPDIVGLKMPIRINGIDTPELKAKCNQEKELALKAKQMTVSMLRSAKVIELKNMKREKYFRILADVYADGVSIGDELLKAHLAVEYDGGTKTEWCK